MVGYACEFWLFHGEESGAGLWGNGAPCEQLIKMHRDTGAITRLSSNRRPEKSLSADHKAVIEKTWERHAWAPASSFTNLGGLVSTYRTTRSITIYGRPGGPRRIPENRSKGSGADTNVSIRAVWYTATGIGLRKTIRTRSSGSTMRRA